MSEAPHRSILSTPQLSAWGCGSGVCRIQTTSPKIAAKLSRLQNTWQVGASVTGGYLRLFDSTQRPNRLKRLLTRFAESTFAREGVQPAPTGAPVFPEKGQSSTLSTSQASTAESCRFSGHDPVFGDNSNDSVIKEKTARS